ncbi:unnamed protein product [Acanthoscelides obtectus]|uniref:Uncharacterized protein n=1 Tax=Acanthoscelides obtectus TaxID=200917 RepID=A0A9P0L8B0_ACAOB|nr:unnamed protein product [Acanthoscelides obtectus]CAK1681629.1 hypothetical protein AOBTE_LOCUS33175 [Acanthoscelides obtectus]
MRHITDYYSTTLQGAVIIGNARQNPENQLVFQFGFVNKVLIINNRLGPGELQEGKKEGASRCGHALHVGGRCDTMNSTAAVNTSMIDAPNEGRNL